MKFPGSNHPTKPFVSYRSMNNLTYPVNVARNIARLSATSHFVFPSDIELYPSPGLFEINAQSLISLFYIPKLILFNGK